MKMAISCSTPSFVVGICMLLAQQFMDYWRKSPELGRDLCSCGFDGPAKAKSCNLSRWPPVPGGARSRPKGVWRSRARIPGLLEAAAGELGV